MSVQYTQGNDDRERDGFLWEDNRAFGMRQVQIALDDLREYADGKRYIDLKATENQEWWRIRHWNVLAESNEGRKAGVGVGSAWTINSLLNKHADIMDSFPKPNILPREADDEEEAKMLTSILPTILDQNDYEQVYRNMGYDICIDGSAITGVFWDNSKHDGMGDVAIANIDVHNLFWQPGINDLQDSDKVYYVALEDIEVLKHRWPDIADKIGPQDSGMITKYIHDDNIDTSNCAEVVNMYYKKTVMQPVYMDGRDAEGNRTQVKVHEVPRTILHLAIIIGNELAFCSENEEEYADGFYAHGMYPFVIRRLFPIKDTPWGFGYLDIMKHPQKDIDKLDQAIIKNALLKTRPRYWVRKNANIDIDQFADWNVEIVEVGTGDLNDAVRQIDVDTVPGSAMNHLANKVEELKETSGNRDFSQGSTASGVTAASAIAALQEAGSKLSRDTNKELYRGAREEYYLIIELIRQFYDESRSFRIDDGMGGYEFADYSNANIVPHDVVLPDGTIRHRRPVFDIMVTAEKQSPFSRAAQNETIKELYSMGLFQPENSIPALVCIDAMDFEGKDKIKQQIEQNSIMLQQFQAMQQIIAQASMVDPMVAQMAMQAGLTSPEELAMMQTQAQISAAQEQQAMQANQSKGTPEQRANRIATDNSYAAKIRERSANAANPV